MSDIKLDTYYFIDLLHNRDYQAKSKEEEKEQQIKHLKHLNNLTKEGILLVAGPVGGGDGIAIGDTDKISEEELLKRLNEDPHVIAGAHTIKIRKLYLPANSLIFTMKQYNLMMDNDLHRL